MPIAVTAAREEALDHFLAAPLPCLVDMQAVPRDFHHALHSYLIQGVPPAREAEPRRQCVPRQSLGTRRETPPLHCNDRRNHIISAIGRGSLTRWVGRPVL